MTHYHVIRSSNENLEALDAFVNAGQPRHLLRPRMTVYRRTRESRRPKPHSVLMYPGYAFVRPEAIPDLNLVKERWTHHYLTSPTTGQPMCVPEEQLFYAMSLERRGVTDLPPLSRGVRVKFVVGELQSKMGTVQETRDQFALVWVDNHPFPVTAPLCDLDAIK